MEHEAADWSQRVVSLAGVGTFVWSIREGEVVADALCSEVLGYTEGYVFSRRFSQFLELVHPDERLHFRARLLALRAGRSGQFQIDQRMRTRVGAWKWVNISCTVLRREEDGSPLSIVGALLDVTQRQAVVDELMHNQRVLSALVESIPGAIYQRTHDNIWTALYISERIIHISGYRASEFIEQRRSWTSLIFPEDRVRMTSAIDEAIDQNDEFEISYRVMTRSGDIRWVSDRGRAVRTGAVSQNLHIFGVLTDITEQKAQYEELELVRAVVENTKDGIIITEAEPFDLPGPKIVYVNPSQCKNSGYSRGEILGNTPRMFTGPNSSKETASTIRSGMEEWKSVNVELLNQRKDGSEYWADLSIVPVHDDNGFYTHWISVQRDVTGRKAQEELLKQQAQALLEAKEVAEAATRAKSDFLATMSHELRTPMNGVIGMTSMLRETNLDAEQRDYLETIRVSGEALLELISDILDYSKGEVNRIELEEHSFDLYATIEESFELVAPKARSKGVRLGYVLDAKIPTRLRGDATRLRQVIVNLLSNGVKFTEQGEVSLEVQISSRESDGEIELLFLVKDSGIGIPEDRMDRLFKPFSQVDSSITRRFGGTGLGLAICRDLVQRMHGEIGVESKPNEGSTFWFTTRLCAVEQVYTPLEKAVREVLKGKKVKIDCKWGLVSRFFREFVNSIGAEWVESPTEPIDIYLYDEAPQSKIDADCIREIQFFEGRETPDEGMFPLRWPIRRHIVCRSLLELLEYPLEQLEDEDDSLGSTQEVPTLRVLLVDDNPINQKVGTAMLRRLGLNSDLASNGEQALELLVQSNYDVVLMDMQMPVMDGLTATRKIRGLKTIQQPFIVAVTASTLEEERVNCMDAGMNGFVSKPVRIRNLKAVLEHCVSQSS